MSKTVEIFEVGPRDGLQNEPVFIALADKIALTEALARTGLPRIECASFVSPKWVPQMADWCGGCHWHNAGFGTALCFGPQYARFAGRSANPSSRHLRIYCCNRGL